MSRAVAGRQFRHYHDGGEPRRKAPHAATYWWNLGTEFHRAGQLAAALDAWQRALAMEPEHWEIYCNIANLLESRREFERAEDFYRQALQRTEGSAAVWAGLGRVLAHRRRLAEAIVCLHESLKLNPLAETWSDLAQTLTAAGRPDEALAAARTAIAINPRLATARCQEGKALRDLECPLECLRAFEAAVALAPQSADAMEGLAQAHARLGDAETAVAWFVRAMETEPARSFTHSSLLFTLSAAAAATPEQMLEAHTGWAQMHASRDPVFRHKPVSGAAERKLRIGFMSGDLRDHAVRFFIAPLLRHLSRGQFEAICYSNGANSDGVTEELRALADRWHDASSSGDGELATRIQNDGIDILVDLSGHTRDNRLLVFARKPAPVQVTYLGYLNTTGLRQMDYWITDDVLHPADTRQRTTERIWRLPRCWVCYEPLQSAPPVQERGSEEPLTFASFNTARKIDTASLRLWARVLGAVPGSRLLIKAGGLQLADERLLMLERLAKCGIPAERVTLIGRVASREEHLALFGKADIALDTVSWSGGTTTAETLWMGVPVVTLAGELMPSRMSASMLQAVGLGECAAHSENEFVRIAVELASNAPQRAVLRRDLRSRMAASPLCDSPGLAREMGTAFRQMWRIWCNSAAGGGQ